MEEPQILAPCGSGRRSFGDSKSPEFEFWMVRNPSFPQPNLLSADVLFSDGILLPLHHLNISSGNEASVSPSAPDPAPPPREDGVSGSDPLPEPQSSANDLSATPALTSSKRWRDIFKKNDKKGNGDDHHGIKEKDNSAKERRREKKNGVGASSAELNINIWPFARSRSARNGGTRPRAAAAARKVSSAPCSRSNSRGESKSRKVPSSPGRAGVHLGRSSPVWQVRRGGAIGRSSEAVSVIAEKAAVKKDGNEGRRRVPVVGGSKAKVMSLNVPMCIGYRQHFSCRSDANSAGGVGGGGSSRGASGEGVRGSNLFNIRGLFTKKVY